MDDSIDFRDWVEKAEGDREGAILLMRQYRDSVAHLIAFSCQQAAEKYLKALLVRACIDFPRTHDLSELAALVVPMHAGVATIRPALGTLQPYAVNVRYPGFNPSRDACDGALHCLEEVRGWCRKALQVD